MRLGGGHKQARGLKTWVSGGQETDGRQQAQGTGQGPRRGCLGSALSLCAAEYQSLCPHGRGYLAPSGDLSLRRGKRRLQALFTLSPQTLLHLTLCFLHVYLPPFFSVSTPPPRLSPPYPISTSGSLSPPFGLSLSPVKPRSHTFIFPHPAPHTLACPVSLGVGHAASDPPSHRCGRVPALPRPGVQERRVREHGPGLLMLLQQRLLLPCPATGVRRYELHLPHSTHTPPQPSTKPAPPWNVATPQQEVFPQV